MGRLYGLTLEESHGRGWDKPFHPDDKQPAWDAWNHATETGETYRIESRLRAADGSYRWFLMRGSPVRDATGRIVKWFGTCTDIDELKRAEEQLRSASQYARSLIEASLDPLVTISADGKITDVNHGTELITGRRREHLIGIRFCDLLHGAGEGARRLSAGIRQGLPDRLSARHSPCGRHGDGQCSATPACITAPADRWKGCSSLPVISHDCRRRSWRPRRTSMEALALRRLRSRCLRVSVAAAAVPVVLRSWLAQLQEQSSILRSTAANSRM